MQTALIILSILVAGLGIGLIVVLSRKQKPQQNDAAFSMLMQQFESLTRTVDQKLGESHKQVNESIPSSCKWSNATIIELVCISNVNLSNDIGDFIN